MPENLFWKLHSLLKPYLNVKKSKVNVTTNDNSGELMLTILSLPGRRWVWTARPSNGWGMTGKQPDCVLKTAK